MNIDTLADVASGLAISFQVRLVESVHRSHIFGTASGN